jgi:hypothetical protein
MALHHAACHEAPLRPRYILIVEGMQRVKAVAGIHGTNEPAPGSARQNYK